MNKTIHFLVSGRVQGVFFRVQTKHQAQRHGINGWVRNLQGGQVEGIATGAENSLQRFQEWLKDGPDSARVSKVKFEEIETQDFTDFNIR